VSDSKLYSPNSLGANSSTRTPTPNFQSGSDLDTIPVAAGNTTVLIECDFSWMRMRVAWFNASGQAFPLIAAGYPDPFEFDVPPGKPLNVKLPAGCVGLSARNNGPTPKGGGNTTAPPYTGVPVKIRVY
jgi:hypothetical protein